MEYYKNETTGMTTELDTKLNWFKIFDYDGYLVSQGIIDSKLAG